MSMSRDVVLRLVGDAESAKRALNEAAAAAGVTVREYRRAETLQRQQAAAAKRLAAEQAAAAQVVGSSMLKMGAVIAGGLALAVKAAIDWESSFAGVKKVLKDSANYDIVEKQLRGLAQILPVTHDEIARVAAAAAQLGVQDRNVAAFTKTMIMLGTTTNLSAEEAAMSIARFSNIMGTSQTKASNLGSSIVWLGNNFATTESEITAMAMRLAGAGRLAGMTEGDVLGLSAALTSVGINAEAGGTAISKVMTMLGAAVRGGGDQLAAFARVAGTSASDFALKWKTEPAGALALFVQGLGRMQKAGGDVNGTLDQLGITEMRMRDALLRSSAAGDLMANAITGANNAFDENNALQNEAAARYETTESKLKILRNGMVEAGISVGSALLPPLTAVVDVVRFVVDGFTSLPGPVQAAIGIMLGLVAAGALGGGALLSLTGRVKDFRESMVALKSGGGFTKNLGGFMGMLGPAAALIGIVTTALSLLASKSAQSAAAMQESRDAASGLNDALRESNGVINASVVAAAKAALEKKKMADADNSLASESTKNLLDMAKAAGESQQDVIAAYAQGGDALAKYRKHLQDVAKDEYSSWSGYSDKGYAAKQLAAGLEELEAAGVELQKQDEATKGAQDQLTGSMSDQAGSAGEAGSAQAEYAAQQALAADAAEKTKNSVKELKDAFDALNGANLDILKATSDMTLAIAGMGEAVKKNGSSLDATTESGAKNVQMLSDLTSKAEDVVTATLQQTGSVAEANKAYGEQREKILASAEAAGLNRDAVNALLDQIFQMPDDLAVPVSAPGALDVLTELEKLNLEAYKASDGSVQIKVDALTDEARAKLDALGITTEQMPDGSFLVTAKTEAAKQALDAVKTDAKGFKDLAPEVMIATPGADKALAALAEVKAQVSQTPSGKQIVIEAPTQDAIKQLMDLGFVVQSVPGQKGVVVTAPGSAEAQAAIDGVNKAAGALSNGETVAVSAPGANQATADIKGTQSAAITLSNGETVIVSAPGANQATGELAGTASAASKIPGSKSTTVTADTGAANQSLGQVIGKLFDIKDKTVTVTVNSAGSAFGAGLLKQADGGHLTYAGSGAMVRSYADGGRENHVAQYAAPTYRLWAEPETGGEWYLPDAPSKRGRSMAIADRMLAGWGMRMIPATVTAYANGSPVTARGASTYAPTVTVNGADEHRIVRLVLDALADHRYLTGAGR